MGLIGYGTYEALSWDIMEPISYVISLINMTAGFGWYAMFVKSPNKQTPPQFYKEYYKSKKLRNYLKSIDKDNKDLIDPEVLYKEV